MKTQYLWIKLNYTVEQRYSHIQRRSIVEQAIYYKRMGEKRHH